MSLPDDPGRRARRALAAALVGLLPLGGLAACGGGGEEVRGTCAPGPGQSMRPDYVGLTEDAAREKALEENLELVVFARDDVPLVRPDDARTDRIFVTIEDDKVVTAGCG